MISVHLAAKVAEIVENATDDPAELLIREGKALQEIGKALKGYSIADSRAIMTATAELLRVKVPRTLP